MGGDFEKARLGKNEIDLSVLEQEEHHSESFGENMEKFGENMEKFEENMKKFGEIIDILEIIEKFAFYWDIIIDFRSFQEFLGEFGRIRSRFAREI